jgi:hypothetical protein
LAGAKKLGAPTSALLCADKCFFTFSFSLSLVWVQVSPGGPSTLVEVVIDEIVTDRVAEK